MAKKNDGTPRFKVLLLPFKHWLSIVEIQLLQLLRVSKIPSGFQRFPFGLRHRSWFFLLFKFLVVLFWCRLRSFLLLFLWCHLFFLLFLIFLSSLAFGLFTWAQSFSFFCIAVRCCRDCTQVSLWMTLSMFLRSHISLRLFMVTDERLGYHRCSYLLCDAKIFVLTVLAGEIVRVVAGTSSNELFPLSLSAHYLIIW